MADAIKHEDIRDDRWFPAISRETGQEILIRKSAVIGMATANEGKVRLFLETGSAQHIVGDMHDIFEKHFKSTLSGLTDEGADLLDSGV